MDYATGRGAFDDIIDPDDENLWKVFWKQKLKEGAIIIEKMSAM